MSMMGMYTQPGLAGGSREILPAVVEVQLYLEIYICSGTRLRALRKRGDDLV
jgi:hypothetical protein